MIQSSLDGRGVFNGLVVLRRATGDSLSSAISDSLGKFIFLRLAPGAYRVSARVPGGYTVASGNDTLQSAAVVSGQTASITFRATPIAQVIHPIRVGIPDTLTVAGNTVIVAPPTGSPPLVASVAVGSASDPVWGEPVVGIPATVTIAPASASGTPTVMPGLGSPNHIPVPVTLTLALPPGTLTDASSVELLAIWDESASSSQRQISSFLGASIIDRYTAVLKNEIDAATRAVRRVASVTVTYFGNAAASLKVAVALSRLTCGQGFGLSKIANGGTGPEPLVLIHGIQLDP